MFFQAINRMITAGTDLSFSIRQVNNRLTVAVMPRRTGLKGEAGGQIVPLVLNGTPEELDAEFLQAISTPVQKAQGILTNLETFEKQAEQAASQNKGAKSPLEKEPKEVREKREKMEKLLKKADEATACKRYSEALTWLRQAKALAAPDKQKDIDAKMAEVQKKASEGSLFGEEQYYMLIIGKNGVTTIIHITVGTTYFNTIVYCREVNRLFCPILYYCDPFVRRIDTDVCRCLRTLILIVTNSEVFCRDILHLALRYEKINHTFLHIIFVSHYQFPLRFQAADQTIHLSSPIGCSRNYHQKVCRPHCLKNTLFYPSIHIFSENQD